jgi:hypothetical protein
MEARPPPQKEISGRCHVGKRMLKRKGKERKNKESGRRKIKLKIEVKG